LEKMRGQRLNFGAEGIRTPDPRNAIAVLYQLSYDPVTEFQIVDLRWAIATREQEIDPLFPLFNEAARSGFRVPL
jgi:hypothetical protein